jgi:hypothetical protein
VTEIYPLNEKIYDEDEFLTSIVTDRPCSWATETANGPSSTKDSSEEGISAGFIGSIKSFPEIKNPFPKPGPKEMLEEVWKKQDPDSC